MAKGPQQLAKEAYERRESGYYVVNSETRIVGARFDDEEEAEREARRRNRIEPITPNLLVVEKI